MNRETRRWTGRTGRMIVGSCVLVGATVLITNQVVSQDPKGADQKAGEQQAPPWMKYTVPGEHHKHIAALAGKWQTEVKMWMDPKADPQVSQGTADYQWIMGGRFLRQTVRGEFMGGVFEGEGLLGYDNFKKKYVSSWIDNMGTALFTSTGRCDESGKVFTMEGRMDDVMNGRANQKSRSVTRIVNKNKHTDEMYVTGADGKEFKMLEITYTRR